MHTNGRNSKLILQIHGEPFGDDMKAVVPNLSSGAKSFEEAKALKSGTAGFVGAMNEIMHFNAMLVVLLSQHHGEHVLEYTADERDNVKTSDIWHLALGAFPAYRARDRHEARRVGGTLVQSSSESRRVPPKITPLLSEVLTLEHWKWSKLRVTTARDRSPIVVCCRLGSLAKSVLACAFKQVPVAIKNRLVLCRRWCAMQRLNQLLSAAYVTCAGAEAAENDVADLLHKRDPGLYYDLIPSSGSLEFLTGLLIELGIKVNHRGGAKGINVIMDIAPRLGKDANLGTKALVPSIGVLPVVPKVQSKVASLLVAVGSASRLNARSDSLDERNARWLALLANGADSTKLHLAWNARVRENQSALQHEKTNSMREAEIKLEGEAKIRVEKPKFKSSQSESSSKEVSTSKMHGHESDYASVLDEHTDPDLAITSFDRKGRPSKNYSLSSTVDDIMVVNLDGSKIDDANLCKRVNQAAQSGQFGCRQYIKPSGSNERYGHKEPGSISVANYQFAHGVEQPLAHASKPKAKSWLKYGKDGSYDFMASRLSRYDTNDSMGECNVEDRRYHVDGMLIYESEQQRELTFAACKEVSVSVAPLKGSRHASSDTPVKQVNGGLGDSGQVGNASKAVLFYEKIAQDAPAWPNQYHKGLGWVRLQGINEETYDSYDDAAWKESTQKGGIATRSPFNRKLTGAMRGTNAQLSENVCPLLRRVVEQQMQAKRRVAKRCTHGEASLKMMVEENKPMSRHFRGTAKDMRAILHEFEGCPREGVTFEVSGKPVKDFDALADDEWVHLSLLGLDERVQGTSGPSDDLGQTINYLEAIIEFEGKHFLLKRFSSVLFTSQAPALQRAIVRASTALHISRQEFQSDKLDRVTNSTGTDSQMKYLVAGHKKYNPTRGIVQHRRPKWKDSMAMCRDSWPDGQSASQWRASQRKARSAAIHMARKKM